MTIELTKQFYSYDEVIEILSISPVELARLAHDGELRSRPAITGDSLAAHVARLEKMNAK